MQDDQEKPQFAPDEFKAKSFWTNNSDDFKKGVVITLFCNSAAFLTLYSSCKGIMGPLTVKTFVPQVAGILLFVSFVQLFYLIPFTLIAVCCRQGALAGGMLSVAASTVLLWMIFGFTAVTFFHS